MSMAAEIIDASDERFWNDLKSLIFDDARIFSARQECENILNITGIYAPAVILDAGCGIGRHIFHFAELGFKIEGIDQVGCYVDEASHTVRSLPVRVHQGNIKTYHRFENSAFDLIVSLYHSIGYSDKQSDDLQILRRMGQLLAEDGQIFFELIDPESYFPNEKRNFHVAANGCDYKGLIEISNDRREYKLSIQKNGGYSSIYRVKHRLFFKNEFKNLLSIAGLSVVDILNNSLVDSESSGSKKFCVIARLNH